MRSFCSRCRKSRTRSDPTCGINMSCNPQQFVSAKLFLRVDLRQYENSWGQKRTNFRTSQNGNYCKFTNFTERCACICGKKLINPRIHQISCIETKKAANNVAFFENFMQKTDWKVNIHINTIFMQKCNMLQFTTVTAGLNFKKTENKMANTCKLEGIQ